MTAFKRIAVLMGGRSAEREVSFSSGRGVLKALKEEGFDALEIDPADDLQSQLRAARPDAVFNALHGRFGEDGTVQGILEWMRLPYTHSGVLASSLAMQKDLAKLMLKAGGVPVPEGLVVTRFEAAREHLLERPYVIKPIAEGSSVGVFIVTDQHEHPPQELYREDWSFGERVLCERYIPGKELTCAVVKDHPTGVIEIVPKVRFYDYEAKYAPGGSEHLLPAPILPDVYQEVRRLTVLAHQALACRGVTRADFRYDDSSAGTEGLVCLEVNTQPGMTETSLVPELATHAGVRFDELVQWMIEDASLNR